LGYPIASVTFLKRTLLFGTPTEVWSCPGRLDASLLDLAGGMAVSTDEVPIDGDVATSAPMVDAAPSADDGETCQGFVASVVKSFDPNEQIQDCTFASTCLPLHQDDVVLVSAGSDGWFYGEIVGMPERKGYFPQCCVSWIGSTAVALHQATVDANACTDRSESTSAGTGTNSQGRSCSDLGTQDQMGQSAS